MSKYQTFSVTLLLLLVLATTLSSATKMFQRMFTQAPKRDPSQLMQWNKEPIPFGIAQQIGWFPQADVVGAAVYGGIVKRDASGRIISGDEWPEDNFSGESHNPVFSTGPYIDFSKLTSKNRGYTAIAHAIQSGSPAKLQKLLDAAESDGGQEQKKRLANLVMAGGARPLHMCGMSRGGDASKLISMLLSAGAEVNAKDNYDMTAMDRLSSNYVEGNRVLQQAGGVHGRKLPGRGKVQPDWESDEYVYSGPGEVPDF